MTKTIYKICPEPMWREAERSGVFDGAPVDLADGFIHFSTAGQVVETAAKHFAGQDRSAAGRDRRRQARRGAEIRGLARRRAVPASLCPARNRAPRSGPARCRSARRHATSFRSWNPNERLDRLGRQLLFSFDPETAHGLSIKALRCGLPVGGRAPRDARLNVKVAGLDFPNPLGMAAGYDKNAEVPDALLGLGFGFAEIGTVTPLPQAGNPKPRIFRLVEDDAVINRLGFNNEGHDAAQKRLAARAGRPGIVGVNIGANKDSADRIADYVAGVRGFARHASYLTVNISSPNTPGLRNMQAREQLAELLVARHDRPRRRPARRVPDLPQDRTRPASRPNSTTSPARSPKRGSTASSSPTRRIARPRCAVRTHAGEAGGLSGKPLFERSTIVLARMRKLLGPQRCRSSASAASIRPRPRSKRSAPAPTSCSSTPA